MEVHKKIEKLSDAGTIKPYETIYICDGCGKQIDRMHMRNSPENREKRQFNMYDNFGNVSHFCRECSSLLATFISSNNMHAT